MHVCLMKSLAALVGLGIRRLVCSDVRCSNHVQHTGDPSVSNEYSKNKSVTFLGVTFSVIASLPSPDSGSRGVGFVSRCSLNPPTSLEMFRRPNHEMPKPPILKSRQSRVSGQPSQVAGDLIPDNTQHSWRDDVGSTGVELIGIGLPCPWRNTIVYINSPTSIGAGDRVSSLGLKVVFSHLNPAISTRKQALTNIAANCHYR